MIAQCCVQMITQCCLQMIIHVICEPSHELLSKFLIRSLLFVPNTCAYLQIVGFQLSTTIFNP